MESERLEQIRKGLDELRPDELRFLRSVLDAKIAGKAPTEDEFAKMLEDAGIITKAQRDKSRWHTEAFAPIEVEGEPVSETIIRERR